MADPLQAKIKLFEIFKSSGIENTLKAQLRTQLVQLFRTQYPVASAQTTSLFQTLINSLIAEYFETNGYPYSLSVFLPESGHSNSNNLPLQDILQALRIETNSRLYKTLLSSNTKKSSLLLRILEEIPKIQATGSDKDTQTEIQETLDVKLKNIEEQTAQRLFQYPQRTIEDRLIKIQSEIEDRTRKEMMGEVFFSKRLLRTQLARFKENELSKMRIEEGRKYREQIDEWVTNQEKKYMAKHDALKEKESELLDMMRKREMAYFEVALLTYKGS